MTVVVLPQEHWGWQLRRSGPSWRATGPDFVDPGTSPAGYGSTPEEAVAALRRKRAHVPDIAMFIVLAPVIWTSLDGEIVMAPPNP